MTKITVKLIGLEGVMKTLRSLPPEVVSKRGGPVRAALRKGAVVIQKEAQANVRRIVAEPNVGGLDSKSTGALEKAIRIIRNKRTESGVNGESFEVKVGKTTRAALKGAQPPAYYQWFLEFGTERMAPHPFMRPAFEAKRMQALTTIVTELNKGIARIVKKLAAQNGVKS